MTLERAIEELVAATLHAENARRGNIVEASMARVRLLRAINEYQSIAGCAELRVTAAHVMHPMWDADHATD